MSLRDFLPLDVTSNAESARFIEEMLRAEEARLLKGLPPYPLSPIHDRLASVRRALKWLDHTTTHIGSRVQPKPGDFVA